MDTYITPEHDFYHWLQGQAGLDLSQMRDNAMAVTVDAELVAKGMRKEKPGVSKSQSAEFAQRVKHFLVFIGWSVKPNGVTDEDWQAYKPFCQELVEKQQMTNEALDLF